MTRPANFFKQIPEQKRRGNLTADHAIIIWPDRTRRFKKWTTALLHRGWWSAFRQWRRICSTEDRTKAHGRCFASGVRAGTGDGLPSFYLFKRIASRLQKGFPEFWRIFKILPNSA